MLVGYVYVTTYYTQNTHNEKEMKKKKNKQKLS